MKIATFDIKSINFEIKMTILRMIMPNFEVKKEIFKKKSGWP